MLEPQDITQELAATRLKFALRLFIGRRKPYTVALAAQTLGIGERTLESYLNGENCPQTHVLLRMCALFGPEFASHVLAPSGLTARQVPDGHGQCVFELNAALAQAVALCGQVFADGKVTDDEREEIREQMRALRPLIDLMMQGTDE